MCFGRLVWDQYSWGYGYGPLTLGLGIQSSPYYVTTALAINQKFITPCSSEKKTYPFRVGCSVKKSTRFTHIGRPKITKGTSVNPSITRASTLLFDRADDLYEGSHRIYGRHGSEVHDHLEEAFCALESGVGCTLTPSGLSANALSILANVKAGDHILVSDSSYGPVRNFCTQHLAKFGVETE